jgi:hypothetical protein
LLSNKKLTQVNISASAEVKSTVIVPTISESSTEKKVKSATVISQERIENPDEKIDAAILTIMKYRTANVGGDALKLLLTFVKNVNDNPTDPKYVHTSNVPSFLSSMDQNVTPVIHWD